MLLLSHVGEFAGIHRTVHVRGGIASIVISYVGAKGQLTQIIVRTIIYVQVNKAVNAWQTSYVGVLPETPRALILYLFDIVMRYPVGILVKNRVREILLFEFGLGIDDGLHAIMLLHQSKPRENTLLERFGRLLVIFLLHVEHRRQVTIDELHLLDEPCGLFLGT